MKSWSRSVIMIMIINLVIEMHDGAITGAEIEGNLPTRVCIRPSNRGNAGSHLLFNTRDHQLKIIPSVK